MPSAAVPLEAYLRAIERTDPLARYGHVLEVTGLTIEARGPAVPIGTLCRIERPGGLEPLDAEVIGFRSGRAALFPLGAPEGLEPGCRVVAAGRPLSVRTGPDLLGRVIDGLGRPLDGLPLWKAESTRPLDARAPSPLERPPIREPICVGVRALDGLLTIGLGQRVGIFSGSGVGKSTLLSMMARGTDADVVVVCLVGERGREVGDFLDRTLDATTRRRSVVVASTSDQPALVQVKSVYLATSVAEFFRDRGARVLLVVDSLTRVAMAQREVGLAAGEPPTTKGYPPSVFALLPRLLERAGRTRRGSITGLYTVLVDGDDFNEPIADAARGLLDGHLVLSRAIAASGRYPAIDVLQSVSRLMPDLVDPEHLAAARAVRHLLATYAQAEDLIRIGAYSSGTDFDVDRARELMPRILAFLSQGMGESESFAQTREALLSLVERGEDR